MSSNSTSGSRLFPSKASQAAAFRSERRLCQICGNVATDIDHDHDSGRIRGHLCNGCNLGLGHFRDSVKRLEAAAVYLRDFASTGEPSDPEISQGKGWLAGLHHLLSNVDPLEMLAAYGTREMGQMMLELATVDRFLGEPEYRQAVLGGLGGTTGHAPWVEYVELAESMMAADPVDTT